MLTTTPSKQAACATIEVVRDKIPAMSRFDVGIVGAGIMGSLAACDLSRAGATVVLIDQSALPNPAGASVDHSKVFRFAYPDPLYASLAVRALELWRSLEQETETRLLTQTGILVIGTGSSAGESETFETLESLGLDVAMMTNTETVERFPQFNPQAFQSAVYDPHGGILNAERAVRSALKLARRNGVTVCEGERVIRIDSGPDQRLILVSRSGQNFDCGKVMIASGPWTRVLLPFLGSRLTTTRQETIYFEPGSKKFNFEPGRFPVFFEPDSGFYGFPVHHDGAMKLANHHKGIAVEPYSFDDEVGPEFVSKCRTFFTHFIPELVDARVTETRVCLYNNTPDDDFIIDWHPELENVLIVSGFSGHGFKFGAAIGRISSELLMSGRTSYEIERFRLARFEAGG
jgi:sarcosine oxidase